jgi:hypothetical protein
MHPENLPKHSPCQGICGAAESLAIINNHETETFFVGSMIEGRIIALDLRYFRRQMEHARLFAEQIFLQIAHNFIVAFSLLGLNQTLNCKNLGLIQ